MPGWPAPPPVAGMAVGALGGLAAGMLGIGGGLVVVPLLTAWLGVPIKRAIGTSLLVVLVTSVVGVAAEAVVAPANLRWAAAAPLALGAVAGALIGQRLVARTPARTLSLLLAALLVVAAARMAGLLDVSSGATVDGTASAGMPLAMLLGHLLAGVGAGVLSMMFGVGGGILAVPALAMLHPDWTFQACRATSLVMIVPTAILAATLHRKLENIDARLGRAMAPAAGLGSVAGVLVANRVDGRPLELIFAAVLMASALKLARQPRERG